MNELYNTEIYKEEIFLSQPKYIELDYNISLDNINFLIEYLSNYKDIDEELFKYILTRIIYFSAINCFKFFILQYDLHNIIVNMCYYPNNPYTFILIDKPLIKAIINTDIEIFKYIYNEISKSYKSDLIYLYCEAINTKNLDIAEFIRLHSDIDLLSYIINSKNLTFENTFPIREMIELISTSNTHIEKIINFICQNLIYNGYFIYLITELYLLYPNKWAFYKLFIYTDKLIFHRNFDILKKSYIDKYFEIPKNIEKKNIYKFINSKSNDFRKRWNKKFKNIKCSNHYIYTKLLDI